MNYHQTETIVEDCKIDPMLEQKLLKFCFDSKPQISAIIMKLNKDLKLVMVEEELLNCSINDLKESLSEALPRYIAMTYILKHPDGRQSFPFFLLFFSPSGIKMQLSVQYSYNLKLFSTTGKFNRILTLTHLDDLNEEWLNKELLRSKNPNTNFRI